MTSSDLSLYQRVVPAATGFGYTYNQPGTGEHGQDVTAPGGSPVYLPFSGKFRADISTQYQAVFQASNGLWESFTHVLPLSNLKGGQSYTAGTEVGTVYNYPTNGQLTTYTGSTPGGATIDYSSTGPHIELGFLRQSLTPGSGDFFTNATLNPTTILRSGAPVGPPPPGKGNQDSSPSVAQGNPGNSSSNPNDITIGTPLGNVSVPSPLPAIKNLAISAGFVIAIIVVAALLILSLMNREGVKAVPV